MGSDQFKLKIVLHVIVFAFSLYNIINSGRDVQNVSFFQRIIIDTTAPIQKGIVSLKQSVSKFTHHYVLIVNASKENEILKKQVAELESQLFEMEELKRENDRLKKLLQFGEEVRRKKVLAQVIGWDSNSDFKVLRINKGKSDGINLKSTVVTANGVVGYIYRVTNSYSDILTILDPNNRVDSIVARARSHGIVQGYNGPVCLMKYVTRTEPVLLNDVVMTSGLGDIYPKGLKIGTITRIERESYGITQFIEIMPSVDFSKIEEVIVLIDSSQEKV